MRLKGVLSARTDFEDLFAWFYFKEDEELREQKERRDFRLSAKRSIRGAPSDLVYAPGSV